MTADPQTADQVTPQESWGEPSSRPVEWCDPRVTAAGAAGMTGLQAMRAIRDGVLPPPIGVVHGGLVCTLLDTVVGCAVRTTLPQGVGYTSIELTVNYLRAVHATSGPLRAVGRVVEPGSRVAFAEGETTDASGRTVATASGSLPVFPLPPAQP